MKNWKTPTSLVAAWVFLSALFVEFLKHVGLTFASDAIGEWIGDHTGIKEPQIVAFISDYTVPYGLPIVLAGVIVGCVYLIGFRHASRRLRTINSPLTHGGNPSFPNHGSNLRMEVGEDGPFFNTDGRNLYSTMRTLNLKVENVSQQNAVTEVKIVILSVAPQSEYVGPWSLAEGFSLAAGEFRFIPLVTYNEANSQNYSTSAYERSDTFLEVLTDKNRPLPSKGPPHFITLRATGIGSPPCDYQCKVWIENPTGRLRIAESSLTKEQHLEPPYISFHDAAARLYGELRGTYVARTMEEKAKSHEDILDYAGTLLAHNAPLVVKKAPSPKWEPFDESNLAQMTVCNGATGFRYIADPAPYFNEVAIVETELLRAISKLVSISNNRR